MNAPVTFFHKMHKVRVRRFGTREWVVEIEYPAGIPKEEFMRPGRLSIGDLKKAVKAHIDGQVKT